MENNEYAVSIAESAKKDLTEIDDYISIELNAPVAARNILLLMHKSFGSLAISPYSRPKVRDDRLAARGYRWLAVKNYLVFYTIDEKSKVVAVERILYNRRNWAHIFGLVSTGI